MLGDTPPNRGNRDQSVRFEEKKGKTLGYCDSLFLRLYAIPEVRYAMRDINVYLARGFPTGIVKQGNCELQCLIRFANLDFE